jgi:hypothetical protein
MVMHSLLCSANFPAAVLLMSVFLLLLLLRLVLLRVFRQSILDVCGQVPPEAIKDLVGACKSGMYSNVQQQVSNTGRTPGPPAAWA